MDSLPPDSPPGGELDAEGWRAVLRMLAAEPMVEFVGVSARRLPDEKTGVDLPVFDRVLP